MNRKKEKKRTSNRLFDIESNNRLTSKSIDTLSSSPELLKKYLETSFRNTFSELIFRLTHEIYEEEKATNLWNEILTHRKNLEKLLSRDVGMLVSTLDYLSNITKDILNPKIIDDLRIEEAATMATRDSLTGLYLRNVFFFLLERLIQEYAKNNKSFSLILIDIDDFKKINDKYGHQTGDLILSRIGKNIIKSIRKTDFPVRYGGDELIIILPETNGEQVDVVISQLHKNLCLGFDTIINGLSVSVSMGVSCFSPSNRVTANELIYQADKALYKAKLMGKNKTEKF